MTKTLDQKITGFLKQHFITVSLVWVDGYLDFNATFVLQNSLFSFFGGGISDIVRSSKEPAWRIKYFGFSASKVQSLGSLDVSEKETWNELRLSLGAGAGLAARELLGLPAVPQSGQRWESKRPESRCVALSGKSGCFYSKHADL